MLLLFAGPQPSYVASPPVAPMLVSWQASAPAAPTQEAAGHSAYPRQGSVPASYHAQLAKRHAREKGPLPRQALASMPVAFFSGARAEEAEVRILCYGDSLTAGFCSGGAFFEPYGKALADTLGTLGLPTEVEVCGHNGGLASEFAQKMESSLMDVTGCHGKGLKRILSDDGPFDLVIIMAGTNDIAKNAHPEEVLRSVRCLHNECHRHGIPTVAMAPPPFSFAKAETTRRHFAHLLRDWAASTLARGRVNFQDAGALVQAPPGYGWMWEPDRLHFNPSGYQRLGEALAKVLLESRLLPSVGHVAPPLQPTSRSQSPARIPRAMAPPLPQRPLSPFDMRSPSPPVRQVFGQSPVAAHAAMVPQLPIHEAPLSVGMPGERARSQTPVRSRNTSALSCCYQRSQDTPRDDWAGLLACVPGAFSLFAESSRVQQRSMAALRSRGPAMISVASPAPPLRLIAVH
eukprot:TRINITY_DN101145_c0_g1_i1.p1 TRINITY_DN101145_c0_g1~~TRINITY_DN101145_c0_g1_i1.p1  ORF type:complete len:460 (-),score=44.24 TRINITY_DN101145_c0_g1_i1:490-1869(-)